MLQDPVKYVKKLCKFLLIYHKFGGLQKSMTIQNYMYKVCVEYRKKKKKKKEKELAWRNQKNQKKKKKTKT